MDGEKLWSILRTDRLSILSCWMQSHNAVKSLKALEAEDYKFLELHQMAV